MEGGYLPFGCHITGLLEGLLYILHTWPLHIEEYTIPGIFISYSKGTFIGN